jgi:hypothetical protein
MKTKTLTESKDDNFYSEISRKDRQYLKHILSPLELAALRHSYKPFNYKIESVFVYISGFACRQLLDFTKTQVTFFTNRMERENKSKDIPRKLREVFEDPAEILSLPAYTRNHLCRLQCYSMFKIMILGRQYFLERKEFGKKSLQTIDDLFAKHGCGKLFH